jgi:hypothetical protein
VTGNLSFEIYSSDANTLLLHGNAPVQDGHAIWFALR